MKKQYQTTQTAIQSVESILMIPAGSAPEPHLAPKRLSTSSLGGGAYLSPDIE